MKDKLTKEIESALMSHGNPVIPIRDLVSRKVAEERRKWLYTVLILIVMVTAVLSVN